MVGVDGDTIYTALKSNATPEAIAEQADHEVSIIGYNATTRTVYINDSGVSNGAGMAVPLKVFIKAWAADDFETTSAVLAQASSAAIAA